MLPRGPADQGGQPRRQVGGGLVSPLLGQPRVPGDVEEAHGRRAANRTVQTRPFQRGLHVLDGALAPGVLLLSVVDGQQRLLHEGGHPGPDVGLGRQHLGLRHPCLEERHLDLGPVPIRLGLDDLAEAVPVRSEQSLDHLRPDPGGELELDRPARPPTRPRGRDPRVAVPRSREPPGPPGGGPRARPSVRSARGTSSRSPPRTDRRRSRPGRRTRAFRPGRRRRAPRAAPRPARSSAPTGPDGRHRSRTCSRCRGSGSRAPPTGRRSPGRPRPLRPSPGASADPREPMLAGVRASPGSSGVDHGPPPRGGPAGSLHGPTPRWPPAP